MDGYNAGFGECSGGVNNVGSNNNDNSGDSKSNGQTQNRGIIGNIEDGPRDGLEDGAADYRSGRAEFARCPGGSLDYCTGYDLGYHDGYNSNENCSCNWWGTIELFRISTSRTMLRCSICNGIIGYWDESPDTKLIRFKREWTEEECLDMR